MIELDVFNTNLQALQARITAACRLASREVNTVKLLPVTKNHGPEAVQYAKDAGLLAVGETEYRRLLPKKWLHVI